ncbi:MAG: BON domain-containing protein [Planctomycetes bacterium]|nr:BON domain-containing protein [Planctomycetota bacterium]
MSRESLLENWQSSPEESTATTHDLERRVRSFLATRSEPGLRRIDIDAEGGRVTLRGLVRSFYERQLAVHCCRRVAGVTEVIDQLNVQRG